MTGLMLCAALVLSVFSTLTVSRAEKHWFLQTGGAVRLDAQGYAGLQLESIIWTFGTQKILQYTHDTEKIRRYGDYEARTEFDEGNFSLLLKNLRLTDSGIYSVKISDIHGKEKDSVIFQLTVQEPRSKPKVVVVLLSSVGGVCNVSVNCSAEDTWASYTCDHTHCSQLVNTTSPPGVSLVITATNGTIQCNSSNWVSTAIQTESLEDTCPQTKNTEQPNNVILIAVAVIIVVLIVIVIIIIIIIIIRKRQRHSEGTQVVTQVNTDNATVESVGLQNLSTVETMYDVVTPAKPEHPPQVNTVYDTLGPQGDNSAKPESIYATVNKITA